MAIFMTGDTHGDFSRLRPVAFREQGGLTKDDYLIICGDFGGVWDGSEIEQQWLDWLEDRTFTTLVTQQVSGMAVWCSRSVPASCT